MTGVSSFPSALGASPLAPGLPFDFDLKIGFVTRHKVQSQISMKVESKCVLNANLGM